MRPRQQAARSTLPTPDLPHGCAGSEASAKSSSMGLGGAGFVASPSYRAIRGGGKAKPHPWDVRPGVGDRKYARQQRLKVDFGIQDDDHVVSHILQLPVQLEILDLHLAKNFSEWTCRGNVLSRLPPPSLNPLRRIALVIDTIDTPELPPYAEFVHELTRLQGENVLEELSISLMCHFDSDLNLYPIRWKELGDLLSLGFPSLRKLTLHVKVGIFDGPLPFEEAARKHWAILERILDEGFALIDPNVESTTSAQCREI
ncbi:hypothetical protein CC2G_012240 [Coprinopsis cinerea AmutBmut pab1-1]|nr:hypothetical protein CC2G_012240 [Coprinopsis cinerea AmutBmut pab1-1]